MDSTRATNKLPAIAALLWAGAVALCWPFVGWHLKPLGPIPAAFPEFPAHALTALAEALVTTILLTLAGAGLLEKFDARPRPGAAAWGLSFLTGAAVLGGLAAWVAFAAIVPLAPIALVVALATQGWRPLWQWRPQLRTTVPEGWLALVAVLLVVVAAMAPAAESDGLRYHLVGPQEWRRAGRFVLVPFSANTNIPAHLGLLAACSSWIADTGRVLQLLHAAHLAALVAICGAIGEGVVRSLRVGHAAAKGALALAAVGIPVVAVIGGWPFSDVASAAYLFAGVWLLGPRAVRGDLARVGLVSLLLGACVATKISNLPLACIAGVWLLGSALVQRRRGLAIVLVLVPGIFVLGPWLAKNVRYHHNPVYPVAFGTFGGPEWSSDNDVLYKSKLKEKGLGHGARELLLSPLDVTVRWEQFEAQNPGPAALALLPAALACGIAVVARRRFGSREALLLALLGGGWLAWFATYQSVRFLIPQLLLAVLLGGGWLLAKSPRAGRAMVAFLALLGAAWVPYYRLAHMPVYQAAVGAWGEDFFIAKRFATYPTLQWLETATEPGEPVFYLGEHRAAYARRFRPVASDWYDTPRVLTEIRATADNAALFARWREQGIRFVLANFAELSLYEQQYFQPRFTAAEWERFVALRKELLTHVAFEGAEGIFVLEVPSAPMP